MTDISGKRYVVAGLGIEGVALARFLAGRGAHVTVTDARPAGTLAARIAELGGAVVTLALGGTDPALIAEADALAVSQGFPLSQPLVSAARSRGVPIQSVTSLAYDIFRGSIAAITGSSGKTTTTHLLSAIFNAAGRAHILGGNIGRWPLDDLADAGDGDWAVLEISHTQLQLTTRSPHIACVTNVTPNHLDQFSWEDYVNLKRNHIRHQTAADVAVLNWDNEVTRSFADDTRAEVLWFSMGGGLPGDGAYFDGEHLRWRRQGEDHLIMPAAEVPLRGRHNVENVLAAAAAAGAAGITMAAVRAAVRSFHAVPHRLEPVGDVHGVTYINDSIATAPERTLAGMRSFHEPLVLLLGGRDKKLPLEELAAECARRCRTVITFGEAGPLFAGAMRRAGVATLAETGTLSEAVAAAFRMAQPGDVVLLSPAGTSFDAYPNFERRGEEFRRLVAALAETSNEAQR